MGQKTIDIIYIAVGVLVFYEYNAKQHSKKQIRLIADWIKQVGFLNPVLIDENNVIIAGHARVLAAKLIGLETVPCIQVSDLTEAEIRAHRTADNKLAELATWDISHLKFEFDYLLSHELNFDIECTGFELPEIEAIHQANQDDSDPYEETIPAISDRPVTQTGDTYACGPHRVGCGDCRDPAFIKQLFKRSKASICITDPPYNVPIAHHVRGKGRHQFDEFAMARGEMTSDEFTQFLLLSFLNLKKVCKEGSLFYVFMDWRHLKELLSATDDLFSDMLNLCVWNKSNGGMGSLYRSKHELIGVFKHGKAPHINNVQLGKFGRDRTNVWDYPGVSSFGKDRNEALSMHPTVKPVPMLADILLDASRPNDIVVDNFLGSGSTLMAAEKVHRRCFGLEIEPRYVDVILQRYRNETGDEPIHADSGLTFTELANRRSSAKGVSS